VLSWLPTLTSSHVSWVPSVTALDGVHDYADKRAFTLGCGCPALPNGMDVLTNIPIGVASGLGLIVMLVEYGTCTSQNTEDAQAIWWSWTCTFVGGICVCFGSSYYHWAPCNRTLVWDRGPIAVIAVSTACAVIVERTNIIALLGGESIFYILPVLNGFGVYSVYLFGVHKQLRAYYFAQYGCIAILTSALVLFPCPHARGEVMVLNVVLYGFAKLLEEAWDYRLYEATGGRLSGHSAKHLVVALVVGCSIYMLAGREPDSACV